ncbi:MAG TPA: FAD-dependent monooxygenase [Vicinamibacterales bacterium]|nr:FAD-dependent monooxygenase [Vicinamibacterales bacterium]
MLDVLIAGAGPAGSIAALVLARAGARVVVVDRETFPRDKLCGDTLNPGGIRFLASLGLTGGPLATAKPLGGMIVTGPHGRSVEGRYPNRQVGLALTRAVFDAWLLDQAVAAGARFESGLVVRRPLVDDSSGRSLVRGLTLDRRGSTDHSIRMPATMTIAADGRHSAVARSLGLASHPLKPRRWAFGVYATGIEALTDLGEMHVRAKYYLGIAPLARGLSNVCLVTGPRPEGRSPIEIVRKAIAAEPALTRRFRRAEFVSDVRVLGPLAVNARAPGAEGLLLAGDASGFIDPMTGDGLSLAMRSAELAAVEALRTLETGDFAGAVLRLAASRHRAFGSKLRFNRMMRRLVDSPAALELAGVGATIAPGLVERAVRYAGDAA